MSTVLKAISYKQASQVQKEMVSNVLFMEWKDTFKETNVNDQSDLMKQLDNIYACFLIMEGSTFIGTVSVNVDTIISRFDSNYWICNLYVMPLFRGKHIGRKILAFIEDYLYKNNVSVGNLWCEKKLCEFYKKNQWILSTGTYPGKPDSCIMIKMLSPTKHGIFYEMKDELPTIQLEGFNC